MDKFMIRFIKKRHINNDKSVITTDKEKNLSINNTINDLLLRNMKP